MGVPRLVPLPANDDWPAVRRAIGKLASSKLGPGATPTFAGFTISGLTASRLVASGASKQLVSADLFSWITGTANRISIADDGDGTITLSLPQDIHTGASPTFAGLTLTSDLTMGIDTDRSITFDGNGNDCVISYTGGTNTLDFGDTIIQTSSTIKSGTVNTNNFRNAAGTESIVWAGTRWEVGDDWYITGVSTASSFAGVNVTSGADPGHTHGSGSITEADPIYAAWIAGPPNVSEFTNDSNYLTATTALWSRAGTVLSPTTVDDDVLTTGTLGAGTATVTSLDAGSGTITTTGAGRFDGGVGVNADPSAMLALNVGGDDVVDKRARFFNSHTASIGNYVKFDYSLQTSTQTRTAKIDIVRFSDITDATRTTNYAMRTWYNGAAVDLLTITGNDLGLGVAGGVTTLYGNLTMPAGNLTINAGDLAISDNYSFLIGGGEDLNLYSDGANAIGVIGTSLQLGDGSGNHTAFSLAGVQTMAGTARVTRHFYLNAASFTKKVATTPTRGWIDDFETFDFATNPGAQEEMFFTMNLPYRYDAGTVVNVTIIWVYDDVAASDAKFVRWGCDCTPVADGEVVAGSATATITKDTANMDVNNTKRTHTTLTTGITNGVAHDQISLRIYRDYAADDYGHDARVIGVHITYTMDKLGLAA